MVITGIYVQLRIYKCKTVSEVKGDVIKYFIVMLFSSYRELLVLRTCKKRNSEPHNLFDVYNN